MPEAAMEEEKLQKMQQAYREESYNLNNETQILECQLFDMLNDKMNFVLTYKQEDCELTDLKQIIRQREKAKRKSLKNEAYKPEN